MRGVDNRRMLLASFGYAFTLTWQWGTFYGTSVYPFGGLGADADFAVVLAWIAGQVLTFMLISVFANQLSDIGRCVDRARCAAALMALGTCLLAVSTHQAIVDPVVLAVMGAIAASVGKPLIMLSWIQTYSLMAWGSIRTASALFISLGAAGILVMGLLPSAVSMVITALLPFGSSVLLNRVNRHSLVPRQEVGSPGAPASQMFPLAFLACIFVIALPNSYLRGVEFTLVGGTAGNEAFFVYAVLVVVGIVAAFVRFSDRAYLRGLFGSAVIVLSFGLVLLPSAYCGLGAALVAGGFCCFSVALTLILSEEVKRSASLSARVVAVPFAIHQAGALAGYMTGALMSMPGFPVSLSISTMARVLLFLVLLALLLSISGDFICLLEPAPDKDQPATLSEKISEFADACGLTKREREVLEVLALGGNVAVIAEKLTISPNTAKSHVKGIYRKAGVGSKEELLLKIFVKPGD